MEEQALSILAQSALFRRCNKEKIPTLLKKSRAYLEPFSSGEKIFTEKDGKGRIGILLSGKLVVYSRGEHGTPLNRLEEGSLFGVSVLFGSRGAGTRITAESDGEILFIWEEEMEPLWEDKTTRKNLVSFLTDRICFLNRKIASFTAGDAEGKLARHLSQLADENGICRIGTSFSELAKTLNLGRASLYRAMGSLEADGIIKKEKKEIRILAPESIELFW